MAESKAVFLDGINAPEIWQNKEDFTIYELGFGTGLNFLNTLKLWLETTSKNQKLFYVATELHPLKQDDIKKAIYWPELKLYRDQLLKDYPNGMITLFDGRVSLKILHGDSLETLRQEANKADGWYLDGFAPNKNPDMWSIELFGEVAKLSNGGAILATFTAAGFVRRRLSEAGFQMFKRPGFGKKREMLKGIYKKTIGVA